MITSNVSKTSVGRFVGIVTLTTDLGLKDYYVGSLKGALLSECPDAQVVDISHEITSFDILEASVVIRNSFRDFPEGTVHIIGVNPNADEDMRHLVVFIHEQYFIMPDNGLCSLIFDSVPDEVVEITIIQQAELQSFPAKDIYLKAAGHITRGGSLDLIGKKINDMKEMIMFKARMEEKAIVGSVVYIDKYGNVITNIPEILFQQMKKYTEFSINPGYYEIKQISTRYGDVPSGEKLALFNSKGMLEIAVNQGSAAELIGFQLTQPIRIVFDDY